MDINSEMGWGIFGKWYPTLKEGWISIYPGFFKNGGCTKLQFSKLKSVSYVFYNDKLIAREDNVLIDRAEKLGEEYKTSYVFPGDESLNTGVLLNGGDNEFKLKGAGKYVFYVVVYNIEKTKVIGFTKDILNLN